MASRSLPRLLQEIRACDHCAAELPLGPRPVVQWKKRPPIVIIRQAPGAKVHQSGIPWDDASGDHLRQWMGVDRDAFYDASRFGLMPMGFCYPGKKGGGDAPPDPRCAPRWHEPLLRHTAPEALILLVGNCAQRHYLAGRAEQTLTETVRHFERFLPKYFPLPHPSWRSKIWMKENPWFARNVLPQLRRETRFRLDG